MTAERSLLAALEAGCSAPVGAYAAQVSASRAPGGERGKHSTNRLHLEGVVLGVTAATFQPAVLDSTSGSGRMVIRERGETDVADAALLGRGLAARMLALGAAGLMRGENTDGNDAHD